MRAWCIVVGVSPRIEAILTRFETRWSSGIVRGMPGMNLGLPWPRRSWPGMGLWWITRPCVAGCWLRGTGKSGAGVERIEPAGNASPISANWFRWTAASTIGLAGTGMRLLWQWIERYGIPVALYTDKRTVYITNREPRIEEQLADEEPMTAFGKACDKLGIAIIAAHSPQAKGRVERSNAVYQDRFLKELSLLRITTIESANKLLANGFTDSLNEKFAREPLSQEDYHRPVPKGVNLADVFSIEEERVVQNDWCIRHNNQHYQITKENTPLPKPKDKIVVRTRLDGSQDLLYRGKPLRYEQLSRTELTSRTRADTRPAQPRPHKKPPKKDPRPTRSPWRQNTIMMAADSGKKVYK